MKSRLTFLDIAKVVSELQSLINCRLANIYDLNAKTILLKFSQVEAKDFLLIEPGTRIHKTDHLSDKSDPSAFNLKLRKYLRTKRLVDISQLGTDRIVKLTFGTLDQLFLFCEFYSQGNIILTDSDHKIVALQRIVPEKHAVGLIYDPNECYNRVEMSHERLQSLMDDDFAHDFKKKLHLDYPIILLDFVFSEKIQCDKSDENIQKLLEKFKIADDIIRNSVKDGKGYILQKTHKSRDQDNFIEYLDVQPWNFFSNSKNAEIVEYDTFNQALDIYFSSIEAQKMEKKARAAKNQADKKLDAAKKSHENQVKAFDILQETSEASARAIELHLHEVDSLLMTLKGYLGSGMVLGDLLKEQARRGNKMAKMVVGLKLDISMVTIILPHPLDSYSDSDSELDSDEDSNQNSAPRVKKNPPLKIDLDIYSSAYANARRYYDSRKIAAVKQEKTLAIADKMLKNTQKKISAELKTATKSVPSGIVKIRKPFWFEKFLWFVSTENYLVIGGRDASQNELLVKRYLKKDDIYVHADLHGAASVVVKNTSTDPIPASTLFQAGTMSVVQSKAWDSKIVTSAWWVTASQVSKTAPSGEYLTTGSFMIRGKKNWLPPVNLVYGFGLFFRVDESSVGRHFYERRPGARNGEIDGNSDENTSRQVEATVPKSQDMESKLSIEEISISDKMDDGHDENIEVQTPSQQSQTISVNSLEYKRENSDEEFPDTVIDVGSSDKYNLSRFTESQNDTVLGLLNNQSSLSTKTRHLSAKERRDMKKKGGEAAYPDSISSSDIVPKNDEPASSMKPLPRGKKGKMKKMKEKYAEQDEEDRAIITSFLGSAQGPQPKGKKAKAEAVRKAKLEELQKEREQRRSELVRQKPPSNPNPNESQEIKQILEEENVALPDEDQVGDLTYLDSLTGQPHQDDILLFAIPVCAPWNSLQKFKYRVKLTPGSLKKGKAAKAALSSFIAIGSGSEGRPKELELIKSIQENELIMQILGKVKISGTGAEKKAKK